MRHIYSFKVTNDKRNVMYNHEGPAEAIAIPFRMIRLESADCQREQQ